MKILLVSDFHFHKPWFHWLTKTAPAYDLVCLAGDLLDAFNNDIGVGTQIVWLLKEWKPLYLRTGVPLAISSGNHDFNSTAIQNNCFGYVEGEAELLDRIANHHAWMELLACDNSQNAAQIITDQRNQILLMKDGTPIVISTIPDNFYGDNKTSLTQQRLWKEAASIKRRLSNEHQKNVFWVVLNHQPPRNCKIESGFGCPLTTSRVQYLQPDFVFCGHEHMAPYWPENSFMDKIGKSLCFNAGQCLHPNRIPTHPQPNHIVIDTAESSATWKHYVPVISGYSSQTLPLG